ncbi:MAG: hypothetical protein ROW48_16235 [Bellilinea sp.]|jgi:predicted enzyme related to lactoylglutathione lyase
MSKYPIVHIEFGSRDREKTGRFYENLFDWKISQMPEMNYATFDSGSVGGGFSPLGADFPAGTVAVYVLSEDIEADLQRAQGLGAKILNHQTEIEQVGWWGRFEDPDGNYIYFYKPMSPPG